MRQILHTVHIHASPSAVFDAITTEKGVRAWWTPKATMIGDAIHFTFAGDFNPQMKQTLDRPRSVDWKCVGGHANWQDNTFRFSLSERGSETLLLFKQDYARELSDEIYGTYNFNWGYYLNSLKLYCERGAGTPFVT